MLKLLSCILVVLCTLFILCLLIYQITLFLYDLIITPYSSFSDIVLLLLNSYFSSIADYSNNISINSSRFYIVMIDWFKFVFINYLTLWSKLYIVLIDCSLNLLYEYLPMSPLTIWWWYVDFDFMFPYYYATFVLFYITVTHFLSAFSNNF